MILKSNIENTVPEEWWSTIAKIVDSMVDTSFNFSEIDVIVEKLEAGDIELMSASIKAYGDTLKKLNDEVWGSSVYVWSGHY